MTRKEIMALEYGPETNALVAEALSIAPTRRWAASSAGYLIHRPYSTNIGTAYDAEGNVPELLCEDYADWLVTVCNDEGSDGKLFPIMHATPLQRCKAILLTFQMECSDDKPECCEAHTRGHVHHYEGMPECEACAHILYPALSDLGHGCTHPDFKHTGISGATSCNVARSREGYCGPSARRFCQHP